MSDAPGPPLTLPSPTEGRGDKKEKRNNMRKDLRSVKLGRLFSEAKKRGISQEQLRNDIAPAQLKKRLSKATAIEIEKLMRFIGVTPSRMTTPHPSSPAEGRGNGNYKTRFEDLGVRDGMALPAQLRKIEAMWIGVSRMPNYTAKQGALKRFLKRVAGVEDMRFV